MFGLNLESPSIATTRWTSWRRKAEPGELPELQYLSDILWGHWIRNNPDLKNLHLYLTHDVVNPETRKLAASAFARKKLGIVKPWPGDVFETNTEEGKALLGM